MPDATIVISTKDRKEELADAIQSSLAQDAAVEVLVIDDGSTDGTSTMVRERFPGVRLERVETSQGYIVQRNRGARMAKSPIVISIDDDAVFPSPRTVGQTVAEFEEPRVGAVAIPYIDIKKSQTVQQRAPDAEGIYVGQVFRGTAYAIRRDVFLAVGGYRESLNYQREEWDYGVRMLDRGYVVRHGNADPIHHLESPRRSTERIMSFTARNNALFAWQNVPWPQVPLHAAGTARSNLRLGARRKMLGTAAVGLLWGNLLGMTGRFDRRPVTRSTYRLFRRLQREGPLRLDTIQEQLPPRADLG